MNKLLKTFGTALAVLTLAPLSASALPKDCDEVCTFNTPCDTVCALPGSFKVITCGAWDICSAAVRTDSSQQLASAKDEQGSEDAEFVCREPRQDAKS